MMSSITPGADTPSTASLRTAWHFGEHIQRAFNTYFSGWADWLPPTAVLVGIQFLACCAGPLVSGPIACAFSACALTALRGGRVDLHTPRRGWDAFGGALVAGLALVLLESLPMIFGLLLFYLGPMLVLPLMLPAAGPAPGGAAPPGAGAPPGPQDTLVLGVLLTMMAGMTVVLAVSFVWSLWLSTRLMFVFPLIADRDYDPQTAIAESWRATRRGFWDLLATHFVATALVMVGQQLSVVGLFFALPLYHLIVVSAYESRFPEAAGLSRQLLSAGGPPQPASVESEENVVDAEKLPR
jgi:hypothetical protein